MTSPFQPTATRPPHPGAEMLAALIDGRLSADERTEVVEHLAACDPCRELFAEAARWVHDSEDGAATEGATVLRPRVGRWKRRLLVGGTLLAAAAVGGILVWGPGAGRLRDDVLPARLLVQALAIEPDDAAVASGTAEDRGWPVFLGAEAGPTPAQESAFRLGVRVFDLDVALTLDQRERATRLTYEIESILEEEDVTGAIAALYGEPEGLRARLASGAPLPELRQRAQEADELLGPDPSDGSPGFADPFWFAFGKWAAAGELAAATGRLEFFESRTHESFVERMRATELPGATAEVVERIDAALANLERAQSSDRLEQAFEELIRVAGGGEPSSPTPRDSSSTRGSR